jgi:hypothetical protein
MALNEEATPFNVNWVLETTSIVCDCPDNLLVTTKVPEVLVTALMFDTAPP